MFNFSANGTVAITASTASTLGNFINPVSIASKDVICYNAGSNTAFVAFGKTTVTAQVPSTEKLNATPVAAGAIYTLYKGNGNDAIGAITSTGTAQMYFTAGQGS